MMNFLQWGGTVLVVASYWFFVTNPRVAVVLSIAGCALAGVWAFLLVPTAWGVLTLEVFVLTMGVRNLIKLQKPN